MTNAAFPFRLYLVISQEACLHQDLLTVAEEAIKGGVDIIQLREKHLPESEFLAVAQRLKAITDRYDVPLIINDNIQIAEQINAAGVHVGNSDISPTEIHTIFPACNYIGYSVEYWEQLDNGATSVSDYLGISPIFKTRTKTDTVTEWGVDGLAKIRKYTSKPLVAIGNMNLSNCAEVVNAGADCVAVVSAICAAVDPQLAAASLRNKIIEAL